MNAATGARTTKRRFRAPAASRRSTMPKAAIRIPATRAPMSCGLAIATAFVQALDPDPGLDPELAEADVGVDRQLWLGGRRVMDVEPVVIGATGRALEDLRRPGLDVGRARHAHVRRHQHLC